jgi:hypothetical protein
MIYYVGGILTGTAFQNGKLASIFREWKACFYLSSQGLQVEWIHSLWCMLHQCMQHKVFPYGFAMFEHAVHLFYVMIFPNTFVGCMSSNRANNCDSLGLDRFLVSLNFL